MDRNLDSGSRIVRCTRLHGTFIVQYNKAHHIVIHCSLFCYIAIHLISGLELSRLRSRSSVYTGQNLSIHIAVLIIVAPC